MGVSGFMEHLGFMGKWHIGYLQSKVVGGKMLPRPYAVLGALGGKGQK